MGSSRAPPGFGRNRDQAVQSSIFGSVIKLSRWRLANPLRDMPINHAASSNRDCLPPYTIFITLNPCLTTIIHFGDHRREGARLRVLVTGFSFSRSARWEAAVFLFCRDIGTNPSSTSGRAQLIGAQVHSGEFHRSRVLERLNGYAQMGYSNGIPRAVMRQYS